MKRNIVIVILIAFNIVLGINLVSISKKHENNIKLMKSSYDFMKGEFAKSFIKLLEYEDSKLQVSDSAKILFKKIFNRSDNTILVYRLSFPYCDDCIFPIIESLKKNTQEFKYENVVIVSAFPNDEYAKEFNRYMEDSGLNVINIPDMGYCLNSDEIIGSYLLTMNSKFQYNNLAFTNKYNFFIINDYLIHIKKFIK